jgi:hypothetical protein
MKILLSTALFFFLAIYSVAQSDNAAIAKGDNIIVIETATDADSSFVICSKYLVQKGYAFQSRDKELRQIITEQTSYAGGFNYKLNIVCLASQIKIRASVQVMTLSQQVVWTDWDYAKAKGNLMNNAFSKFYPDVVEMKSYFPDSRILFMKD